MSKSRTSLLAAVPLTLAVGVGLEMLPPAFQPVSAAVAAAANPCAPGNPCAPAKAKASMANPCAPAPMAAPAAAIAAGPFEAAAGTKAAPFGDAVGTAVKNYSRPAVYVGAGGQPEGEGVYERLKALGFKAVVNLRTEKEGSADEAAKVRAAGLGYVDIPVSTEAPTIAQVAEFAKLMANSGDFPVLVHCHTGNRVGAMWALYRSQTGTPAAVALEEGRAIGLEGKREAAVRAMLGLAK